MENFNYWKYREAIPRIKVEEDGGGGRGGGRGRGGTTTTTTTNEDGTGKETVFQVPRASRTNRRFAVETSEG